MGVSTDAILAYGVHLGEDLPDWADDASGHDNYAEDYQYDYDDMDPVTRRLLQVSGFTERYDDGNVGYYERAEAAVEALPVQVVVHCSAEAPLYVLAARGTVLTAARGWVKPVPVPLTALHPDWDTDLSNALDQLGIDVDADPRWLLFSYWG